MKIIKYLTNYTDENNNQEVLQVQMTYNEKSLIVAKKESIDGTCEIEEIEDKTTIQKQIRDLKLRLISSDYKIIKCYEYSLNGLELPYDIQNLHKEREMIREQIRKLQIEI